MAGYRVYQHEINEPAKTLKLWVRRKRGNPETGLLGLWAQVRGCIRQL